MLFETHQRDGLAYARMAVLFRGRPVHQVYAYSVDGLLVDTGYPQGADRLLGWARKQDLERVVLTHHHEDHVGGAAVLREELSLPILASSLAIPRLARAPALPFYRRLVSRRPRPVTAQPLSDLLEHRGRRYRIIPTPGHAFDHVCLYDEERRWLFSGDLYVHPKVTYLRRIEDVWQHLDSLRRVRALEPERLFCAHAGPVDRATRALERKIEFWENLAREVGELHRRGLSSRQIRKRLVGSESLFSYLSLGDFSKLNLIHDLLRGSPDSASSEEAPAGAGESVS
ncbi:MAG: MBL fold metallo-hydrolase [Acidobacteriota bacterium]|nr:MBL fold metallo-hydrolase [Acidobacteriota bacterium]